MKDSFSFTADGMKAISIPADKLNLLNSSPFNFQPISKVMITIKAKIKLYSGISKRKTPFTNGYRPLFDLIEQTKTSGMIALIDREEFKPGDEGVVDIKFLDARCFVGQHFFFYESEEPLGEGVVLEILDQTPRNK